MQDPDTKCRHFGISWHFMAFFWHFMAFWHFCQKVGQEIRSDFIRFLDFSRLPDFPIPQLQTKPNDVPTRQCDVFPFKNMGDLYSCGLLIGRDGSMLLNMVLLKSVESENAASYCFRFQAKAIHSSTLSLMVLLCKSS